MGFMGDTTKFMGKILICGITATISVIGIIMMIVSAIFFDRNGAVLGVLFDIGGVLMICGVITLLFSIGYLSIYQGCAYMLLQMLFSLICIILFAIFFRRAGLTVTVITSIVSEFVIIVVNGIFSLLGDLLS